MNISLLQVLNAPLFENVKILSGRAGLGRIVKRASVFDAPFKEDVLEKDILAPGDFFSTSLLQFQPKSEELMQVLALLVKGNCSGLCVMMEERAELFSKEMLAFCEEKQFPVICMREDISYAEVLGVINQCILEEQTNVLNQLKLDKILASRTLPQERMKILFSINPGIREYVQAVYIRDERRKITQRKKTGEVCSSFDIFIPADNYDICILSADSRKELEQHKNVVCEQLLRSYHNRRLGIGRPYARYRVERTLLEAGDALDMAQASDRRQQVYDPLSPQQLLLPIRGSREMQEFYDEFCREIAAKTTEEGMEDMLLTTRAYVQCNGDFKKTAKKLKQHENTIRYRINRLRNYLDVEEQPLLFHEIISLAVRIESMLEIKKNKEV